MKPNIFNYATKELSQDGCFTWLLEWADSSNNDHDKNLNETAKDFVRFLIGQTPDYAISKVSAGRQWNNIDIWAEVNDEYLIVIEDKTNSGEHSEQLQRYKDFAEAEYKDKNFKLVFIYLKTGNESSATLNKVREKGYAIIDRKNVLEVFNRRPQTNEIFNDFNQYLTEIETQTNSFNQFENLTSNWKASEGFYNKLQDLLGDGDWRYVANQMGGFLGFWYNWNWFGDGNLYIQIENAFNYGIKLVVKIDEWEPDTETLYEVLEGLQTASGKHEVKIVKPDKYRAGATSTVAIIDNAFSVDSNGILDIEKFVMTLRKVESTIDDFCKTRTASANS